MTTYTVLVYEADEDEGGYWATVAELPGCGTTGETMDEIEETSRTPSKPTSMPLRPSASRYPNL